MFSLFFRKRKKAGCNNYIDPLDYNATSKRLNRAGVYCSYYYGMCETSTITYNPTSKRLIKTTTNTPERSYCPDYYVDIDLTNKRLKYYRRIPCGVT
jgi:hypothetical protein